MKQIPRAYYTVQHGPVFAYATRDDVHACCVTWRDHYVVLEHDHLLEMSESYAREDFAGAVVIRELEDRVQDAMAHAGEDDHCLEPRSSAVGEAVFGFRLFTCAVYRDGEEIEQGFGKTSRRVAA